jgi:NADH dehydrogenase, FAD-containing subunit
MATIGHLSAVTDSFGMKFTGVTGYTMWGIVHVLYLIGWGNRVAAILELGTGADLQQEPPLSDDHLRTRAERARRAPP